MDRLDVVAEHRDYCPWINTLSQNGARRTSLDGLAGWEALLRAVDASVLHKRHESEDARPLTARTLDTGAGGEVASVAGSEAMGEEGRAGRDERDRERWAKLKRLKQAFHVKRRKGKEGAVVGKAAGPKA